jgi:predicted dinucleotide-binding enzyme
MAKKIGVIGSGVVGLTLANGFLKHGYDVTIGTNDSKKRDALKSKTNGKAGVGLCILWCIPGFRNNSWTHAFKLLKP